MEIGFGFLVGVMMGTVVAVIVAVILIASRKVTIAARQTRILAKSAGNAGLSVDIPSGTRLLRQSVRRSGGGREGEAGEGEKHLDASVQEIRVLLLRLADIIASTAAASGQASETFASAREVIDAADPGNGDDLAEAQLILIGAIDRVLSSNAALQGELENARRGIAEQRRQIEELRTLARVDSLTRTPNRAAFDERLGECLSLLDRAGHIFSLLMLDIDHFKNVNDGFGHLNGDRLLRGVAGRINESVRTEDFVARYGGEEFAVIFPETRAADAFLVAERIRQDIANAIFRMDGSNLKMSVSGGITEGKKGMRAEEIIAAADRALYRAKNSGRNRVEMEK